MPQLVCVHTRAEPLRVGAEVHDAESLAVAVEPEVAEHREHEIARPAADRDERGRAPEHGPRRAALEDRLPDLVLLAQHVGTVEEHTVRHATALQHPAGRVPRRLHVAAMHEADAVLAGEAGRAAPAQQPTRPRPSGGPAEWGAKDRAA